MNKDKINKIVFVSFSKRNFYLRSDISAFVLKSGNTPVSPFMNFDYNLGGLVNKDLIRIANNTLIERCDEVWIFGEISDGVMMEIYLAKKFKKIIKFFKCLNGYFEEININQIVLEDVSPWIWEWIQTGKKMERWHPRLRFNKKYKLVYPAYSKRNFFWQTHISKFCFENKKIPLNPFMLFRYFLGDSVSRESIYWANEKIVALCDEVWVFGEISDGVLKEIKQKEKLNGIVKYFRIINGNPVKFRKILANKIVFEKP